MGFLPWEAGVGLGPVKVLWSGFYICSGALREAAAVGQFVAPGWVPGFDTNAKR